MSPRSSPDADLSNPRERTYAVHGRPGATPENAPDRERTPLLETLWPNSENLPPESLDAYRLETYRERRGTRMEPRWNPHRRAPRGAAGPSRCGLKFYLETRLRASGGRPPSRPLSVTAEVRTTRRSSWRGEPLEALMDVTTR